jgi:serpin B
MIRSSLLALCAALHVCHAATPIEPIPPAVSIASAGWSLVRAMPQGNAVVSPFSIWSSIGMAHAGAAGDTASEMAAALNAPNDSHYFAQHIAQLQNTFEKNAHQEVQLHSANRMWVQENLTLEPLFLSTLQKQFHSSIGLVNFRTEAETARQAINQWVAKQTQQRISHLLPSGSVDATSALVLTNALYLKAPWSHPFDPHATQVQTFHVHSQSKIQVPLMQRYTQAMAGKMGTGSDAVTVCEIPYEGGHLKMVLYVPEQITGLDAVLAKLEYAKPNLQMQPVHISLPKWKAKQSLDLNDALQKLGMHQAFDARKANFSRMRAGNDLYISKVIHQSFVEVNEAGTEAAAATAVSMLMRTSIILEPKATLEVRADRPFAWAIVENSTGTPLFTGVVRDPR